MNLIKGWLWWISGREKFWKTSNFRMQYSWNDTEKKNITFITHSSDSVRLQNVIDINDGHANSCVNLTWINAIVFLSVPPGKCAGCTSQSATNFLFIIILWVLHNQLDSKQMSSLLYHGPNTNNILYISMKYAPEIEFGLNIILVVPVLLTSCNIASRQFECQTSPTYHFQVSQFVLKLKYHFPAARKLYFTSYLPYWIP